MIYVFLANGFEEVEALAPVDFLRRAGASVMTVGVGGVQIEGAQHITVTADSDGTGLDFSDVEMVVLPGGMPGAAYLDRSPMVKDCLMKAAEKGALIGAICAAPSVLGHKGLLEGRRAVCYPGFEEALHGAILSEKSVEQDGNIITAKGPGAAIEFALTLVAAWSGDAAAQAMRESIQCPK